jgi:hypothetical protein
MRKNFVVKHGLEIASGGITINQGGLNIVGGDITLPSVLRIGTASGADRFPNTIVSISNTTLFTKPSELHNIGLLAEGTANGSDTTVYGIGVYGVGYTAGGTRSGGVVGEGHVSDTTDTGSSIGVRGYALDAHAGGMNIGLYGSAANGSGNYALYMASGDINSATTQSWFLNGDLTFSGAYTVTIPTLSSTTVNATSVNNVTITKPAANSTLTILDGKTLTANNTLTFTGTDSSSVNFAAGGDVVYKANKLSDLASTTSTELAGVISDETGTGSLVFANTPTLVTPALGVATATSINKVTFTVPLNGSTLTIADGKTLTANNTLTFTGTDSSSVNFAAGGDVVYKANKLSDLASTTSTELAGVISDETGTGSLVFADTPTVITPNVTTSITTDSTTFALIDTNATTVHFARAATAIGIGSGLPGITTINHDLQVAGNITFGAGATQLSATVINVEDPLIYLADNNPADILDIGIVAAYNNGVHTHTGLIRDASDSEWKLFSGVVSEPVDNVIDLTGAVYDNLKIGGLNATTGTFSSGVSATQLTSTIADGTAPFVVTSTTTVANLKAAKVETNANLTGVITSIGNATSIASQTGTGSTFVVDDTPTLKTPVLGVATATSINKVAFTAPTNSATLTLADGSTLATSGSNSITLTSTGTTNATLPAGTVTLVDSTVTTLSSLASVGTITTGTWSGSFGSVSGSNLTNVNAYGLKTATGVVAVSSATAPTNGQVLMASNDTTASWVTPAPSGVTSVSGTGTVNGLSLSGTVTSTGNLTLGGTLSVDLSTSTVTGTLPVTLGGTGVTNSTGTGSVVLSSTPTLVTPVLGVATATSINKVAFTAPEVSATLTLADGSALVTSGANSITLTSTDTTNATLPAGTVTLVDSTVSTLSSLSSVGTITTGTWSGSFGSVSGATLTDVNAYGLKTATGVISISGSDAPTAGQVLVAIGNTSATWQTVSGGSSATGTVTDVTGTGNVNGITLTGTVTDSGSLTLGGALTGVDLTTQVTGILPIANGGTGASTVSGTGNVVMSTSPAISTSITTPSTTFSLINTTATNVNFAGAATTLSVGGSTGSTTVNNNLIVSGNFTVNGTNNIINTNNISVTDSIITLATGNTENSIDIGIIGLYNTNNYTGLVRDASDSNTWKLFEGITTVPTTTVDFTSATYGSLKVGALNAAATTLTGALSGTTGSFSSTVTGTQLISNVATGTAPLVVTSTTPVNNLNINGYAGGLKTTTGSVTTTASANPTTGQFLIATGTSTATWQTLAVSLTSQVSGVLPTANGGTGTTTSSGTGSNVLSTSPTITGLKETNVTMAANDINLSSGNYFTKTISTATTLTVSNVPDTGTVGSFILNLTNGGAAAITWWSGMKWAAGTPPTLTASGRDSLGFYTYDGGTTWTGLVLSKDIK